ncbi:hypothetical protein G6K93_31405 [Agrobacterium rhizogenes]|nr:hypothetical protein [Rhizobium rhizogenes]
MPRIVLLHLSDLHFSKDKMADQAIVIKALAEDIYKNRLEADLNPDLVFFSGDLVQAGEDRSSFDLAYQNFIEPVLKAADLPIEKFHIVPGNHDISRASARSPSYVERGLKEDLNSTDVVNQFVDSITSGKDNGDIPFARLQNYEDFQRVSGNSNHCAEDRFLKTYRHNVAGVNIGIACFNTAWRSTGENDERDRRSMLLGERNVDNAISELAGCSLRLAMFHHPFDWLTDFDEAAVSSRLMAEFDVLMCGHIHRNEPQARLTPSGNAILSQSGCIYQYSDRKHFNGYQYIIIDFDKSEVNFEIRSWYDAPRRSFDKALNISRNGEAKFPLSPRAGNGTHAFIEAFLREVRPGIRDAAANQINIAEGSSSPLKLGPKDAFICPPLKERGDRPDVADVEEKIGGTSSQLPEDDDYVTVEAILRSSGNYLIVGNREAGKTSLAHFIAVTVAEGLIDKPRIPVVIDHRLLKSVNYYNLSRSVASYFGATKTGLDLKNALEHGDLIILLDNFNGSRKKDRKDLIEFMLKYPQLRWIAFSDARSGALDPESETGDLLPSFKAVHIQQLPRRSIRELTSRWCEQTGSDPQKTFDAIMGQLRSSSLPRTGYIVTLLLWAMYQEKRFERINEAVLLTNIVDHLLGKADFTQALLKEFDATANEITLQSLAAFLRGNGDFANRDITTKFLIDFFDQKALKNNATDVLSNMIKCGILNETDGLIGFKYRCFQEYFFAGLLRSDSQKLTEVVSGFRYVEFSREIDLLTGLRRQNSDVLVRIGEDLRRCAPVELSAFSEDGFTKIASMESALAPPRKQISEIRKKRLNTQQLDDLLDKTERGVSRRQRARVDGARAKAREFSVQVEDAPNIDTDINTEQNDGAIKLMSSSAYLAAIDLFGRVIRNSEFNDAKEKLDAARTYLDGVQRRHILYSEMFSDVIDAVTNDEDAPLKGLTEKERSTIKYIINQVWVQFTVDNAADVFGTPKLINTYQEIFNSSESNLFEKVVVASIMMDGFMNDWHKHMEKVIDLNINNRFILDSFVAKIWNLIHSKHIPENERLKIEKVLDSIERSLGTSKHAKGFILETVRKEAKRTEKRLDG